MEMQSDMIWGAIDIAKFLNLTPRRLYRLVEQGALPVARIGGHLAASKSALERHIESLVENNTAANKKKKAKPGILRRWFK